MRDIANNEIMLLIKKSLLGMDYGEGCMIIMGEEVSSSFVLSGDTMGIKRVRDRHLLIKIRYTQLINK